MNSKQYIALTLLFISTLACGYLPQQQEFPVILLTYLPAFTAYYYLCISSSKGISFLLGSAIALRVLLLPAFPNLSDDLYRFIWDGRLWVQGVNPYLHLPSDLMLSDIQVDPVLFDRLNSPDYYTIYPPLAQYSFALASWFFPQSLTGSVWILKILLFMGEMLSIVFLPALLRQMNLPSKYSIWYLLNPLVMLETCVNLHYEGLMVGLLLVAFWSMFRPSPRLFPAALWYSLSIGIKLLPLLFLPFWLRHWKWKRWLPFYASLLLCSTLLFAPFLEKQALLHFSTSLDLYFRHFEFNASVYYLLRALGYWWKGYNLIALVGPGLGMVTFLVIWWLALRQKITNDLKTLHLMLLAITLYFLLSTTVHPWYLILPLALSVFTRFRFPVVWSGLVIFSYSLYDPLFAPYHAWWIAAEYGLLALFILFEITGKGELNPKTEP